MIGGAIMGVTIDQQRVVWLDNVWRKTVDDLLTTIEGLPENPPPRNEEATQSAKNAADQLRLDTNKLNDARNRVRSEAEEAFENVAEKVAKAAAETAAAGNTTVKAVARQEAERQAKAAAQRKAIDATTDPAIAKKLAREFTAAAATAAAATATQKAREAGLQVDQAMVENKAREAVTLEPPFDSGREALDSLIAEINTIKENPTNELVRILSGIEPPPDPPDYPKVRLAIWLPLELRLLTLARDFELIDSWKHSMRLAVLNTDLMQLSCRQPT